MTVVKYWPAKILHFPNVPGPVPPPRPPTRAAAVSVAGLQACLGGSGAGLLGSGRDCVSRRGTLKETSPLLDEAVELS